MSRLTLAAAAVLLASPALADPLNLITNGGFETVTNGNGELSSGQTGTGWTTATGWSVASTASNANAPFDFVVAAGTATTGFADPWDNGNRELWGAANGGASTWDGTSVDGGNFMIMDGDYHATAMTQAINTLVVGHTYTLAFDWAAGQWHYGNGDSGNTTETFHVAVGDETFTTATYNLVSHGFSGWMHQTFTFTYDGSSDILSFLAAGTPVGEPPMLLLDGVSLYDVPEPAAWSLLLAGVAASALVRRRGTRPA